MLSTKECLICFPNETDHLVKFSHFGSLGKIFIFTDLAGAFFFGRAEQMNDQSLVQGHKSARI